MTGSALSYPVPDTRGYIWNGSAYVAGTNRVWSGPNDPTGYGYSPSNGDQWRNTSTRVVKFWWAGAWQTVTQTFSYTGASQNFVVPNGVTVITVTLTGAAGGSGLWSGTFTGDIGGSGASVSGTMSVTPGEVLQINVGQCPGQSSTGGFNGGGAGTTNSGNIGGGGGGGTDIRQGGSALANRYAVAGGGGGGGNRSGNPGGAAGAPTGTGGSAGAGGVNGGGATTSAGGSAGTNGGNAGALGQGGAAGGSAGNQDPGGGGGGYYGGGGAGNNAGTLGGGGGGSSLVPSGWTSSAGANVGTHGSATISY